MLRLLLLQLLLLLLQLLLLQLLLLQLLMMQLLLLQLLLLQLMLLLLPMVCAFLAEPAVLEHLPGHLLGGQDVVSSEAGFGGVDVRGECAAAFPPRQTSPWCALRSDPCLAPGNWD